MPPAPRRRVRLLLGLAVLLLAAAAFVFSGGAREPIATEKPAVAFPVGLRPAEEERITRRATLQVSSPQPAPGEPAAPPLRDPFLIAMPIDPGEPVVVLEANALRHSRLGELFVACVLSEDADAFASIQRETGLDPLKDLDRIGFVGRTVIVSGFFDRLKLDQLDRTGRPERHGDAGQLWISDATAEGRRGDPAIALWKDQLLLLSSDPAELRRAIDRLEGRAPVPDAGFGEDLAYGEVYGVIPGDAARALFGRDEGGLGARLAAVAQRIEVHVDAQRDLAAFVRVQGEDADGIADLAKAIGAALAVARVQAQATSDARFAELLESARVHERGGALSLELAVPVERLEAWFEGCGRAAPATSSREDQPSDG